MTNGSRTESVSSAIVLLSAGLDSSFNLIRSLKNFKVLQVLTFNYGQRAATREVECARRLAARYQVEHRVVDLPWFQLFSRTALVGGADVPSGDTIQIDDLERSKQTAARVWVPNRNGIFLNVAAGFAEGLAADFIVPGFNKEEAVTFPDNSKEFLSAMDQSLHYSTQGRVKTFCFSTDLDKTTIVAEAVKEGLDLALLWPCYLDGSQWCGACESCQRFERAVEANGVAFTELQRRSG